MLVCADIFPPFRAAPCRAVLCCAQFDPELLADQRRRGWGDRQLTSLGIETRPDGTLMVSVAVERVDGKILRCVRDILKSKSHTALHSTAAAADRQRPTHHVR